VTTPLQLVVRRTPPEIAEISLAVPSDLGYVGEAVELVATQCRDAPLSPRRLQFNLRTALAEALANAIAYGNRHDRAKLVRVRVHVRRESVEIHVADDGDGFDPTAVDDPTRPENLERETGRGLFVLQRLVDQVSFNEKGNAVCLILRAG
jgi:serine/threonine-protein kinase RsbW